MRETPSRELVHAIKIIWNLILFRDDKDKFDITEKFGDSFYLQMIKKYGDESFWGSQQQENKMGRMKEYAMQLEEEADKLVDQGDELYEQSDELYKAAKIALEEEEKDEEVIIEEVVDDGKEDLIFGFDIEGEHVQVCTIHQEFLDIAKIEVEKRLEVAQGISQMFLGMLKPFIDLAK